MSRVRERRTSRRIQVVTGAVLLLVAFANPAWAHPHVAQPAHGGEGQVLANGANHPRFVAIEDGKFESCESYGPIPGSTIHPAWYGLETAHHGPDSGKPGKADGCYVADGNPAQGQDDQNPAIN
jgi:hypothetical protein